MAIAIVAPAKALAKGNVLLSGDAGYGTSGHEKVTSVDKASTPGRVIVHTVTSPNASQVYSLLPDTPVVVLKQK